MGRPPWLDDFDDDWLEFSVTPEKVETFHRGFTQWIREQAKESVTERLSASAFRWFRSMPPMTCRCCRSTATAASSTTSPIPCSAQRPTRASRT